DTAGPAVRPGMAGSLVRADAREARERAPRYRHGPCYRDSEVRPLSWRSVAVWSGRDAGGSRDRAVLARGSAVHRSSFDPRHRRGQLLGTIIRQQDVVLAFAREYPVLHHLCDEPAYHWPRAADHLCPVVVP